MRVLLFLLSLIFSFSFIAIAEHFNVPTGKYLLSSVNLNTLKHILILDSRSSADRKDIEALKKKNYACTKTIAHKVKCYKFLRDVHPDFEVPVEEWEAITPVLDKEHIISLISEAEDFNTYNVEQNIESLHGSSDRYKLYVYEDGNRRFDVSLGKKTYRYNYTDENTLTHYFSAKKQISRKERQEVTYILEFQKTDK